MQKSYGCCWRLDLVVNLDKFNMTSNVVYLDLIVTSDLSMNLKLF